MASPFDERSQCRETLDNLLISGPLHSTTLAQHKVHGSKAGGIQGTGVHRSAPGVRARAATADGPWPSGGPGVEFVDVMKAAPFAYFRPGSLAEALELLAEPGPETRIIAGGQSLVPMMAMRLARPDRLVDIAGLEAVRGLACEAGQVVIGAGTVQAEAERSPVVAGGAPLLAAALAHVGHAQTRNRGTVGGSIAHADPAAEILLAAIALRAGVELASARGTRRLAVRDLAVGPMMTAAEDDELLVRVFMPVRPDGLGVGAAVDEVCARAGDFAVLAAAAEIGLDDEGVCRHLRLAVGGASPVPVAAEAAERALLGARPDADAIREATRLVTPLLEPEDDLRASAAYRRRVAPGLLARALARAVERAAADRGSAGHASGVAP